MRDMHRRELKKLHDTKSGQAAGTTHESKWQYFTSISFVNAVMIPRPTLSNVPAAQNKKLLCSYKSGHTCRIKCSHMCLRCIPRQMLVSYVVLVLAPM